MAKRLSQQQVRGMQRDGFLAPVPIFGAARARRYRAALEAYETSVADRPKQETLFILSRFKPHLLFTWLDEICHDTALVDAVEDLIGPDILVFSTAFFTKNARDGAYVPWHQDTVYAAFEGGRQVRAWVALTDSHPGNGCMRAIPGTHRQRFRHIETPGDENNILFRKESIADELDESRAVDLVLKPGEASFHDYGVVHGSNPNTSGDRRIGFAIAYVTPDTLGSGRRETGMLVRGRDPTGLWDLEPRPQADLDAAARAAHARAMQQRTAHFFREMPEIAPAT